MKESKHPPYQDVLFVDSSTGTKFLIGSTFQSKETDTYEGKEYPVCKVAVSSASHPLFTGSKGLVDAEGRVDKFTKKYKKAQDDNKKRQLEKQEAEKAKLSLKKKKKK